MIGPVRRGYLIALGADRLGAAIFDDHSRLDRKTFGADPDGWPQIGDWLADRGAIEVAVPQSATREFVVWLATQPFVLVHDEQPRSRAKIVSWRDTITVSASTRWFEGYDELTATSDIAGFAQIEAFLGRCPAATAVTLIDANGTSASLVQHLQDAGWTLEVKRVTDPWLVTVQCNPATHEVCARANGAYQRVEMPNDHAGSVEVVSWIEDLGSVRGVIITDADKDSTALVELLQAARIRHRVERATRGELAAEPGEEFGGVRFQLALRGLGWLVFRMRIGDEQIEVVAGHMTSAWHDTISGIRAAFDARTPVVIVWSEEPGAYQLVLSRLPQGHLDMRLRFLPDDLWGRPDEPYAGDIAGRWTVETRDLARAFASASYQLLRAVPAVDLDARWSYGAPVSELELLAIRASM
ncbi:MAG TPA: hypothetical protein VIJ31_12900 [Acidothermaceae bacterium]